MAGPASPSEFSIAIVGAGAIGLDLAAALTELGHRVALLARGATLEALRARGIELRTPDAAPRHIPPTRLRCAARAEALGPQELVFLTTKSGAIDQLWPSLAPLIGPRTTVVSAMNGLPRWLALERPAIARHLGTLPLTQDESSEPREPLGPYPGLPLEQHAVAIVNRNAARPAPGVVERCGGAGLVVGALHGRIGPRLRTIAQLDAPDYQFELSNHIERELWHKLMINAAFNPLSVLCELSLAAMVARGSVRDRLVAVLDEVHALGVALELVEPGSFAREACFERFATRRQGATTSMLRDYRTGRVLELDRIVRAPLWLAARPSLAHPMPALSRLLSEVEDKAGPLARAQTKSPW